MSEGVIYPANAGKDVGEEPTKKRFIIVFCLFIGIFIAYLDRVNVSVLAANDPFLLEMGIKGAPVQIGMMMSVFLAAYGVANVLLAPIGGLPGAAQIHDALHRPLDGLSVPGRRCLYVCDHHRQPDHAWCWRGHVLPTAKRFCKKLVPQA